MTEKAESVLKEIFGRYSGKGIEAMYLWGSILREDFNPEISDIDSIGIANDATPLHLEDEIKQEIQKLMPEISKFGFRLLYKSELSGEKIKSLLATYISPQSHILDLPNWKHVAGKEFNQSDFLKTLPTYYQAIISEVPNLKVHVKDIENIAEKDYLQLTKKLAQIVDLIQKERGAKGAFSYTKMLERAQGQKEQDIAGAIMETKKSNYNPEVFRKHLETFKEFITYIYNLR
jgi:predicted nucleotidyltransferase